ncbi:MAG: hypothetical protein WCK58_03460 [Chloroflexota bacterium]
MRLLPNVLALLAIPAAVLGYALGVVIMTAIPAPDAIHGFLVAFGPLLVAGLCVLPMIIPFFDRMAKRDLAAAPGRQPGATAEPEPEPDRPAAGRTPNRRRPKSGDRRSG